ncbi:MAG: S46 family peptidase [Proteobacteria bacterium]|nr:S46 family peptidase [Pseudomonadota bacterium]
MAVRKLLAKGGRDAIDSSYDPMIVLAKSVDEAARSVRKNLEDKVQEPLKQAYAQIAAVSFAANGTAVYPDATFTLRLAFGTVSGYSQAGAPVPAWTTIGGAFEHELAHESREPYVLPKTWHDAKNELDLSTPFNFVSTADIIGGNSGSPVVNRDNKLVGLIFDGNIQSLTADFVYSDIQSRAVSVDVRTMTEAMSKIYKTEPLLKELMPL